MIMKAVFFIAILVGTTGLASAQTHKMDTASKPAPPPSLVTVKRISPPVIVKDTLSTTGSSVKNHPKCVPPPPPKIIRDSPPGNKN